MTPLLDEPWRLPGLEISVAARSPTADWLWHRVAQAPPEVAAHVRDEGLALAEIDHADGRLFFDAANAITWAPSLAAIVATRVRAIHLLHAEPGYDVSHSEPRWRERIFASVPNRSDDVGALRLAESIIHEALHLHLTELETIAPLVRDQTGTLASPWRPEPRGFGGVLHGAFVFVSLRAYFDLVIASSQPAERHLDQRRREIAQELSQLDSGTLAEGLTDVGAELISRLLAGSVTTSKPT